MNLLKYYFLFMIGTTAIFPQRTQKTITGEVVDQYNNLLNGDVVTLNYIFRYHFFPVIKDFFEKYFLLKF